MIETPNGRSEWRLMLARNFYRRAADEGNAAVSELEERRALIIFSPFLTFSDLFCCCAPRRSTYRLLTVVSLHLRLLDKR